MHLSLIIIISICTYLILSLINRQFVIWIINLDNDDVDKKALFVTSLIPFFGTGVTGGILIFTFVNKKDYFGRFWRWWIQEPTL